MVAVNLGPLYLIAIQVVSRALTFVANQILLRHISPTAFGLASQIELFSISVLVFSRESIRLVSQRQPLQSTNVRHHRDVIHSQGSRKPGDVKNLEMQSVVNISYAAIAIGAPMVYGFGKLYLHFIHDLEGVDSRGRLSFRVVQVAALLELLSEPMFAVIQHSMLYRTRAAIEMVSSVSRAIVSCGVTVLLASNDDNVGILPMALGQLAYAAILLGGYFTATVPIANQLGFYLYPKRIRSSKVNSMLDLIPQHLITLSISLYMQSVAKHILAQSDSLILASLSSLEIQGQYALASNYGGLLARTIFQPIEEYSRNLFSRLVSTGQNARAINKQATAAKTYFTDIMRGYTILCVLMVSVGPGMIPLGVKFVIGSRWNSLLTHQVLATYCYYLPFLALNGITEAFVSGAAKSSDLLSQTKWMGFFSVFLTGASYFLLKNTELGVEGLVWANIIHMLGRIIWSSMFIKTYFQQSPTSSSSIFAVFPKFSVWVIGFVGWLWLRTISTTSIESAFKILVTVTCTVLTM
ncbi:Oligosaccharide translocation protein rft1 [Myotisia sp. PD_48]|nr:Oligosaccharide translocation protein rft1 [Myotisia sp. PD_48]